MIPYKRRPVVMVVSAASGAGKTTLCERLLAEDEGIRYSVSCTTRPPRKGEVDGDDYHFLTPERFQSYVEEESFLEHAEVHGMHYGTLQSSILDTIHTGCDVLLDIDVQGAEQIRQRLASLSFTIGGCKIEYLDVFIAPPSMEELERRLRGRGSDNADVIQRRLKNALHESEQWSRYQYVIFNDQVDSAFCKLQCLLSASRCRV